MKETAVTVVGINAPATKESGTDVSVEVEGSSMLSLLAQVKQSIGDLALFDDVCVEADIDQAGPRAKSHFRLRCYRRSGG